MELYIEKTNSTDASEILRWKYSEPYNFYNNELSPETIHEMLDDSYYSVFDLDKGLVGFFCVGSSAQVPNGFYTYSEHFIDLGLGMRPELTGKGYGSAFFTIILHFINKTYGEIALRLTVAKFNQRAIHLYEKHGFHKGFEFIKGSSVFVVMMMNDVH
jgi:ribosomal-protein-alanine N-acetyltransferase